MFKSLGFRLLIIFFLTSLLISVGIIFIEIYRTVNRYNERLESDLKVIEKTVVPPLIDSIWSFDIEQTQLLSSGLLNFDSVIYIEVLDPDKNIIYKVEKEKNLDYSNEVFSSFNLKFSRNNKLTDVGTLRVYQKDIRQNTKVKEDFIFNFLYSLIQIIIYMLILLLILSRHITHPLVLLASKIQKIKSGANIAESFPDHSKRKKYSREIQEIESAVVSSFMSLDNEIKARLQIEKSLIKSLNEKKVLLREIHHRVKNNLQIVVGLLHLQQNSVADSEAKAILSESQNRIYSMALVHEMIYQTEEISTIYMNRYLSQLGTYLVNMLQSNCDISFEIIQEGEEPELKIDSAIPCGLIVNELITNSCKHAFPGRSNGHITLTVSNKNKIISFSILDDGIGFTIDFEQKIKTYNSVGLNLIKNLCIQLNADFAFENTKSGTLFRFELEY